MLSVLKNKVCKEIIYVKKHAVSLYSLEEVAVKFKKSKDQVSEMVNFFAEQTNYEKLKFAIKWLCSIDGKYKPNINVVRNTVNELLLDAIQNFLSNPNDSIYVSENIILAVSSYSGKHYISIAPRLDYTK